MGEGAGGGGGWSAVFPRLAQRPAGGVVGLQVIQLHQEQSSIWFVVKQIEYLILVCSGLNQCMDVWMEFLVFPNWWVGRQAGEGGDLPGVVQHPAQEGGAGEPGHPSSSHRRPAEDAVPVRGTGLGQQLRPAPPRLLPLLPGQQALQLGQANTRLLG